MSHHLTWHLQPCLVNKTHIDLDTRVCMGPLYDDISCMFVGPLFWFTGQAF